MKTKFLIGMALGFMVLALLPAAYAHGSGQAGGCPWGGHAMWGKGHEGKEGKVNFEKMFFHKAYFLMASKDSLGLSQDQVESIQNLKLETKKNVIRQQAETQLRDEILRNLTDEIFNRIFSNW